MSPVASFRRPAPSPTGPSPTVREALELATAVVVDHPKDIVKADLTVVVASSESARGLGGSGFTRVREGTLDEPQPLAHCDWQQ